MSTQKPRLSRAEEATYWDYLRQLQAEGIDVEIPEESQENSGALRIVLGGPTESVVFESATGGVCYAVLGRLVAERSGLILAEWGLSTHFDQEIVPGSFDDRDRFWSLGGQLYRPCEVLNSRIEKGLVLTRGQIVEGWLLATGVAPIPAEHSNLAVVPFWLSFWDQFANEIVTEGRLSALRRAQRDITRVLKGSGLYGPDATGKPPDLSVEEDARRRYIESLAREKLAQRQRVHLSKQVDFAASEG
jgi:hypothetical protein